MSDNKRLFARSKINIDVKFEFVKWKEKRLDRCKEVFETSTIDISAQGVGLSKLPVINEHLLKQLYTGKKKIRLSLLLYPDHTPINTFARLVWDQEPGESDFNKKGYGFEFIDIPEPAFKEINTFVKAANKE